jgi:SulP family sulfate permease
MPISERALLVLTFLLTVFLDLTVAIGVGVTLASLMFVARMSQTVALTEGNAAHVEVEDAPEEPGQRDVLPAGVEVFQMRGPLFFGAAADLLDAFRRIGQFPRVFIVRMRLVPYLDASVLGVIEQFVTRAEAEGCRIILSGVQPQPATMLARAGFNGGAGRVLFAPNYPAALALAADVV